MVCNILIPHCFNSVKGRFADNTGTLQTNSIIEGLRGQLCCGFAGGLQLSIKVLTQTAYAKYRAVIQSYLTALFTIPQIHRKAKHELNRERIQWILELLRSVKFHCVKNRRNRYSLSDLCRFTGRKFSHGYDCL